MTEDCCELCRFWRASYRNGEGACHRHAPTSIGDSEYYIWKMLTAVNLLTWWYIREKSDDKIANEQLTTFGLGVDDHGNPFISWPPTDAGDWCGDFEAKPAQAEKAA